MNIQNDISKGHDVIQNDISKNNQSNMGILRTPLEKALFASVKKIEKIVAAVYLVTDVMDESLPITAALRSESITLLSVSYDILTARKTISRDRLTTISLQIDHVVSLVKIGEIARHISPMNADVINTELGKIAGILNDEINQIAAQEKTFMTVKSASIQPLLSDESLQERSFDEVLARYESKRHQNDIKTTLLAQKDIIKDIEKSKTTFQKDIIENKAIIDRKTEILNVIKSRATSTVNDIKLLIKNCSDKTIQREINEMVAMGIIKKEGNKRWTTYRAI